MTSAYIYERQTEYWTSRQIEEFFLDQGFEICALPIPMHIEYLLPADFTFFDITRAKLFGLQYKALCKNSRDHWKLDLHQHLTLQLYPWISYCLSELKTYRQLRSSLHMARIANNQFTFSGNLYPDTPDRFSDYRRWASFYAKLEECTEGLVISSQEHLKKALMGDADDADLQTLTQMAVDIFLVDFASRRLVHYSPLMAQGTP